MDSYLLKAKALLQKYSEGTCTDEEKAWVEEWYLRLNARETDLSGEELEEDLRQLKTRLERISRTKSAKIIRLRAVAAVFLLLAGVGLCWYMIADRPSSSLLSGYHSGDVHPGRNRAVLTLANGRVIDLDSAGSGVLAAEGGVIIRKGQGGQIVYKARPAGSATAATGFNTVSTPNGGQYKVVLPDGTQVWLNAASSLRYPVRFAADRREVFLSGEAYFDVTENKDHPFVVQSSGQSVTVTGTEFNINAYENESVVATTLVTGSIRVREEKSGNTETLRPGQQSVLGPSLFQVREVDANSYASWKNGQFVFYNVPLPAVLRQIERWYDVSFERSRLPEDITFWGSVSRQVMLSELLEVIAINTGLTFRREGRRIMIIE